MFIELLIVNFVYTDLLTYYKTAHLFIHFLHFMNFFNSLFQKQIDKFLDLEESFDPRFSPDKLLKVLKNNRSQMKYFKKQFSNKTDNPFKLLRRLSLFMLMLIHSNNFYQIGADLPVILSNNKWINDEFLGPCYKYIKKVSLTSQLFTNIKKSSVYSTISYDMLFYDISLLKLLFKIVAKMPLLGRYYKNKAQHTTQTFISTISVHAQKIYVSFRTNLGTMIQQCKTYITNKQDQKIMKYILKDQLPQINEEMKKLFLDKYFYPLGRGIGIKLFRPQQQNGKSQKTIRGILNDHEETERKNNQNELERTLFPVSGGINMKFYEETLLSNMKIGDDEDEKYEEVVDEVDIYNQQEEVPQSSNLKQKSLKQQILAQTNTGVQKNYTGINQL